MTEDETIEADRIVLYNRKQSEAEVIAQEMCNAFYKLDKETSLFKRVNFDKIKKQAVLAAEMIGKNVYECGGNFTFWGTFVRMKIYAIDKFKDE